MRRAVLTALATLLAAWPLCAGDAPEVKPPDAAPGEKPPSEAAPEAEPGGAIPGTLTPPDRVLGATLWERDAGLRVPLKVDAETGAFEATGLKLGVYDLVIRTPWGRVEGVDMTPRLSGYDALVPPEYRTDEPVESEAAAPLTDEDLAAIRRHIHEVKRHENRIRDLDIRGAGGKAVALVELMLDRDFVGRKGDEVIWRMELWFYEKKYDAWARFRTRVLHRIRASKRVWATWGWQFEPAVGGLEISEGRSEPLSVTYTVPEKPVEAKGLAGEKPPPEPK